MTQHTKKKEQRDHGGGIDEAIAKFGGTRNEWIDLSTGINPIPYPLPRFEPYHWAQLPDKAAFAAFETAARKFWNVPNDAQIIPTSGASAIIALLPSVVQGNTVDIPEPTYNEHRAAFAAHGWKIGVKGDVKTIVHPNNPDGRLYALDDLTAKLCIIDESFCDIYPDNSMVADAVQNGHIVIKSFGKFWGLAGMRLGAAIVPNHLANAIRDRVGPWAVSGPALYTGTQALNDNYWAIETRKRLTTDAQRLDDIMLQKGVHAIGGTSLFRLYHVENAHAWQERFAQRHILTRIFPYSETLLRLGLPAPDQWQRVIEV